MRSTSSFAVRRIWGSGCVKKVWQRCLVQGGFVVSLVGGVSVEGPATGVSDGVRSSGLQCRVKFLFLRSWTQPISS